MAKLNMAQSSDNNRSQLSLHPTMSIERILKPEKTINIAVSGDVQITKLERDIIDTAEFQRLRYIKQLGTTYLVYPTATHTRFDHSLGTLMMAQLMLDSIMRNPHNSEEHEENTITNQQVLLTRLFALLHDIQHVPFGHTLEDEFSIYPRHDEDTDRALHFLGPDSTIGKIIVGTIGQELYDRLWGIFTVDKEQVETLTQDRFIFDIVNNTVCADLLDYLRRDSFFCNLDLQMSYRFLNYLYISWNKEKTNRQLVIRLWKKKQGIARRDILSELIRLLDNRYLLAERVYFHHAKMISGAMIAGAVGRSKQFGKKGIKNLWKWGDEELLSQLRSENTEGVGELSNNLRTRSLWKQVYSKSLMELQSEQENNTQINLDEIIDYDWRANVGSRRDWENNLAELHEMTHGDLLVSCPDRKMAQKYANMTVLWNGELTPLAECKGNKLLSTKLKSITESHETLWSVSACLNPKHKEKRERIRSACEARFLLDPLKHEAAHRNQLNFLVGSEYSKINESGTFTPEQHEKIKEKVTQELLVDTKLPGGNTKITKAHIRRLINDELKRKRPR